MRVSFIIPVKEMNDFVIEAVQHLRNLEGDNWEAFVVTNRLEKAPWEDDRVTIIASGRVGPGDKRDLAASIATGQVLVFLDDDSYPRCDYLTVVRNCFARGQRAVGGPAVTASSDSYWQQVSGAMFLSQLTGGAPERYAPHGNSRRVLEWPSVNFAVGHSEFMRVGGFDSQYWPGEDTFLCDRLRAQGVEIWYEPTLLVSHHRRANLFAHLQQVGRYGLHRGFFARRFRASSFRFTYFAPSLLFISACILLLPTPESLRTAAGIILLLYIATQTLGVVRIAKLTSIRVGLGVLLYAPASHFWYGIRFLQGYCFTIRLRSRLR